MSSSKSGKTDSKEGGKTRDKPEAPLKVVIRHLPPSLTKDTFIEQVSPLPEHNYFRFCKADLRQVLGQNAYSRAYIAFKDQDSLFSFSSKFDGYVFVDARGNEYQAMVEYTPYQKISRKAKKEDSRKNTIENDSDYLKFLDNLSSKPITHIGLEQMLTEIDNKAKEKENIAKQTTPLIMSLVRRREERQRVRVERVNREQRRREAEERKEIEKKKKIKERRERDRERKDDEHHRKREKAHRHSEKHSEPKKSSGDENFSKRDREDNNADDGSSLRSSAKSSDRPEKTSRTKSSSYYRSSDRRKPHSEEKSRNRGDKVRNRDRPQRELYVAGKKERKNGQNE
ncbi:DgyrCDS6852 [Dimorphilus gyrociliatus]|uniref:DgyrCDS6852 n=1 Tax=Dimorphilus gyrociliatus TaxID=2664684 RepID=A0A7I8VRX4_9ANNE|nr:DgyrCDS6852 [Dimorphilus gyrociliatus]